MSTCISARRANPQNSRALIAYRPKLSFAIFAAAQIVGVQGLQGRARLCRPSVSPLAQVQEGRLHGDFWSPVSGSCLAILHLPCARLAPIGHFATGAVWAVSEQDATGWLMPWMPVWSALLRDCPPTRETGVARFEGLWPNSRRSRRSVRRDWGLGRQALRRRISTCPLITISGTAQQAVHCSIGYSDVSALGTLPIDLDRQIWAESLPKPRYVLTRRRGCRTGSQDAPQFSQAAHRSTVR